MRTLFTVAAIFLIVHLLAGVAGIGWLYSNDRLNMARVEQVIDLFSLTLAEEQAQIEHAYRLAQETQQKAVEAVRLEQVAKGTHTLDSQLRSQQLADDIVAERLERLRTEREQLQRTFRQTLAQVQQARDQIERQQRALEQAIDAYEQRVRTEEFRRAVRMYEGLEPAQAKRMLGQLLAAGQEEQVVDYLMTMQPRKAVDILGEFREGADIQRATQLIEALRKRGVTFMQDQLRGADNPL